MIPYDQKAKEAVAKLKLSLTSTREEIIIHSQFRRNCATSPRDPEWGKPNPIDIDGIIELAFAEGLRYANEAAK